MSDSLPNEFYLSAFAKYYQELSDSFIEIHEAVESLKRLIKPASTIFEIGIGTGYFASYFYRDGYAICGIQPKDEMILRLKADHPDISLLAEQTLEAYRFEAEYDVIVSHSAAFLFTQHRQEFGHNGEVCTSLVFQSFIQKRLAVYHNISKVLLALAPTGKLFINVQDNPPRRSEVGPADDRFVFEMTRCDYDFERETVKKIFQATYQGGTQNVQDVRYCSSFSDFITRLECIGGKARLSDDGRWVIVER